MSHCYVSDENAFFMDLFSGCRCRCFAEVDGDETCFYYSVIHSDGVKGFVKATTAMDPCMEDERYLEAYFGFEMAVSERLAFMSLKPYTDDLPSVDGIKFYGYTWRDNNEGTFTLFHKMLVNSSHVEVLKDEPDYVLCKTDDGRYLVAYQGLDSEAREVVRVIFMLGKPEDQFLAETKMERHLWT